MVLNVVRLNIDGSQQKYDVTSSQVEQKWNKNDALKSAPELTSDTYSRIGHINSKIGHKHLNLRANWNKNGTKMGLEQKWSKYGNKNGTKCHSCSIFVQFSFAVISERRQKGKKLAVE